MSKEQSSAKNPGILVFAHVPPPVHGQSLMVEALLNGLREKGSIPYFHVDARFSEGESDVGSLRGGKFFLLLSHLVQAVQFKFKFKLNRVYYVPGPPKLSAIIRDIVSMLVLRLFYSRLVLHWHAVGLGAWAAGQRSMECPAGTGWSEPVLRIFARWALGRADLSIVIAPGNEGDALFFEPKRVEVVPNGIEDPAARWPDARAARPTDAGLRKVLFLSRCTAAKGVFEAIEGARRAAADSPAIRWELTLAGGFVSREEEQAVRAQMAGSLPDNLAITTTGFVTGEEKAKLLRESDILVFPSHTESFGLVAVEALASGLPVIGTDIPGIRSILEGTGCPLVPVGDAEAVARALKDAPATIRPGALRERYVREFTVGRFQERMAEILA